MNATRLILASLALVSLAACGTISTETTTLPFDVASTSGDAASSASGSTGGGESSAAAQAYLKSDMDWIKRDAARGQGEHLAALASLMGEPDQQEFGLWLKRNYAAVFSDDAEAAVYQRIVALRQQS